MRLSEIEDNTVGEMVEADDMAREAEENRKQAEGLQEAAAELAAAQSEVDSEGLQGALEAAAAAQRELERRQEELRQRKEELLSRNEEMLGHCERALEREKAVLDWGPIAVDSLLGTPRKYSPAANLLDRAVGHLKETVTRTEAARDDLLKAREALRAVEI